jgi:hypothetical protein
MKDLTPKFDNTGGPTGQLTADEFNDFQNDSQNAVTASGQTLTAGVGDDNRQMLKAIAVGGERVSRGDAETAQIGEIILPDNSAGAITINLPNAGLFVNATVVFEPVDDQLYSINSLTVGRGANMIMGLTEDMIVNSESADNDAFKMTWKGGSVGWVVSKTEVVGTTL